MSFVIVLLALVLLMFVAYRGFSVILFAPVCALLAVLATDPSLVLPEQTAGKPEAIKPAAAKPDGVEPDAAEPVPEPKPRPTKKRRRAGAL